MTSLKDWISNVINTGAWHSHFVNSEEEENMRKLSEAYIRELEQHMNRMKAYYPKVLLQWDDAVREVLRFLRGENK